jgi:DNA-binding NarL/FixJ family response regulator
MTTSKRQVAVAVLAGHPVMEAGIRSVLEADGRFVIVHAGAADVVVVDGLEEAPGDALVVRLIGPDAVGPLPATSAPAGAIISRDASDEALAAAVLAVAAGLVVADPDLERREPEPGGSPGDDLTPREMQVLRLLAEGKPNKGIAFDLGVSEHTAKFHVGSILSKLDAGSRTEAVTIAIRRGLLPL